MSRKMTTQEQAELDKLLQAAVETVGFEKVLDWSDDPRKVELIKALAAMNAKDKD